MCAITYARVSTDAQERDGTSLDSQERACLDFARTQGWFVVESVRDAASGFSLDRPGIVRVRQLLRQGVADVVIAYAVDRLSRNQNQFGVMFDEIQQAGARLEFVTERFEDTAVGRFILAARAFVGEVEREKIVERGRVKLGDIDERLGGLVVSLDVLRTIEGGGALIGVGIVRPDPTWCGAPGATPGDLWTLARPRLRPACVGVKVRLNRTPGASPGFAEVNVHADARC
jgi:hypothetical protein